MAFNDSKKKTQEEIDSERKEYDKKRLQYDIAVLKEEKCFLCDFQGLINAVDEKKEYYAFRCGQCRAAELLSLSLEIPLWTGQEGMLNRKFELLFGECNPNQNSNRKS